LESRSRKFWKGRCRSWSRSRIFYLRLRNTDHTSNPTFIFQSRFRPESQIYRVSQDMRNSRLLVA